MTSPGRRNSTDQFPSTVGFALKSGSTSSSTDAFAPTPDVETILNGGKPGKPFVPSAGAAMTTGGATTEATKSTTTTPIVQGPSGPRMPGQGVEEQEQVVVSTETDENGGVRVRVTLLAAGFVIGNAAPLAKHTAHRRFDSILDATGGVFFSADLRDQREFFAWKANLPRLRKLQS